MFASCSHHDIAVNQDEHLLRIGNQSYSSYLVVCDRLQQISPNYLYFADYRNASLNHHEQLRRVRKQNNR